MAGNPSDDDTTVIVCVSKAMAEKGWDLVPGAKYTGAVCDRCWGLVALSPTLQKHTAKLTLQEKVWVARCVACMSDDEVKEALRDGEILPGVRLELAAWLRRQ